MYKLFSAQIALLMFLIGTVSIGFAQNSNTKLSPTGKAIKLKFNISGIGIYGNIDPKTLVRNVDLLFYSPDINPEDPASSPLATFSTTATYDGDFKSDNYGSFVNQNIDLGNNIPKGKYQIVVKTEKVLPKLIKTDENAIVGELFELGGANSEEIIISAENMLPGDVYPVPKGDGIMDIDDYNLLAGCFSLSESGISCPDEVAADLDDNGVLDGVDYNLMFASFARLEQLGFSVPSFDKISPTVSDSTEAPIREPTEVPIGEENETKVEASGGAGRLIAGIFVTLVLLAGVVFLIIKRQSLKSFLDVIIHKNTKKVQSTDKKDVKGEATLDEFIEENIDKEYFVKKQAYDEVNKATVLTLTDDAGPTLGYYSKNEEINEGFFKVKGTLKKKGDKVFIDVSKLAPSDQAA